MSRQSVRVKYGKHLNLRVERDGDDTGKKVPRENCWATEQRVVLALVGTIALVSMVMLQVQVIIFIASHYSCNLIQNIVSVSENPAKPLLLKDLEMLEDNSAKVTQNTGYAGTTENETLRRV
ncbi:hypothetical protein F4604DRAFT_1674616 [Suillus subluteus]|nr:hypothetical protein F4604DRAFT_1674616 [Suillus subluteus]